jgi:hypothetical protein
MNIFRFFPRFVVAANPQKCGHYKLALFIWLLLPYLENLKSSDQTMMLLTLLLTLLLLPGLQTWQAHSPGLYHPVSAHFVSLLLSIEPVLTLVVNLISRLFPLFPLISLAQHMFFWIPLVCLALLLSKFCIVSCKISPVGHF